MLASLLSLIVRFLHLLDFFVTKYKRKLKYYLSEIVDSLSAIPKYVCSKCMNVLINSIKFVYILEHLLLEIRILVKLTDIKYQKKLIDQIMSTVGSDELRTGEKEENVIYIKEEVIINETQCVDELDIKELHLLYETKEEFLTSEHNVDFEFVDVNSIKCESIPSGSNVSASRIEDLLHEHSKYFNGNSNKTNKLTKSSENNVTEKKNIKKTENFRCTVCSEEFPHKLLFKFHLKVHPVKNYECSICKRKFMQKTHLQGHEKIHTRIKNYECSICKKKFIEKISLVRHQKIHIGIKNYECTICKKKYVDESFLIRHKKIHTTIKNYKCLICSKRFVNEKYLIRHEKVHTCIYSTNV